MAEFPRQQQSIGTTAADDSRWLRPELPECWPDCLSLITVDRVGSRTSWREILDSNHVHPTFEHPRRIGPRYRLLRAQRCGQANARAVHRRLLLLPRGQIARRAPVADNSGCTRSVDPVLILFACAPAYLSTAERHLKRYPQSLTTKGPRCGRPI
jgi:hypothetical protein